MEVQANVIKGGNSVVEIVAHVVCRDANGQIRWEDDAKTTVVIPYGVLVPEFQVEGPVQSYITSYGGAKWES